MVMAPMTTWSANADGTVSNDELDYYRARVKGVGLVLTGCTHVRADGIGFVGEFAGYDDRFTPSLRRLAEAAKSGGAPAILQIFHAGNKAVPNLVPNSRIVSASALKAAPGPFNDGEHVSVAMDEEEIWDVIASFGETTRRAIEAGFDGVELHGAHGFLIQNFLSPLFNQRDDAWGGSLEGRMRFALEVVREARRAIAAHADRPFLLGYRVSPEEFGEGGLRVGETMVLSDELIAAGIDYLHVSLHDLLQGKPLGYEGELTTIEQILGRVANRVPVIAAGQLRTPAQAEQALSKGLSLVAIGKGLVMNPGWVEKAQAHKDAEIVVAIESGAANLPSIPHGLVSAITAAKGWFPVASAATSPALSIR